MYTADGLVIETPATHVHRALVSVLEQGGWPDELVFSLDGEDLLYYWEHVKPALKQVN